MFFFSSVFPAYFYPNFRNLFFELLFYPIAFEQLEELLSNSILFLVFLLEHPMFFKWEFGTRWNFNNNRNILEGYLDKIVAVTIF